MKYTIYKTNQNLASYRWWRNYDNNHRNLPDTDIEKYIADIGYSWVELKNTRGEAIKYESISRDSFDLIELYLPNIDEIPDYIKIEFELAEGKKESLYYYLDNIPSLYNAVNRLNAQVRYTLDKYVGFYKFHTYLQQRNPQMFYVQKHHDRFYEENKKLVFDYNKQPWYLESSQEFKTYVKERKTITTKYFLENLETASQYKASITSNGFISLKDSSETPVEISIPAYKGVEDSKQDPTGSKVPYFKDSYFSSSMGYQYIITKPKLRYISGNEIALQDSFLIWPISNDDWVSGSYVGTQNTIAKLYKRFPLIFNDSNIVGRMITNIPPSILGRTRGDNNHRATTDGCFVLHKDSTNENYIDYYCIISDGKPVETNLRLGSGLSTDYGCLFNEKLAKLYSNINTNKNYLKTKDNNPHLLAPQFFNLTYKTSTNDMVQLTADYMDLSAAIVTKLGFISSTYFYTRIIPYYLNQNKDISTSRNEFSVNELRQAPIQCDAFNNTWLQRQALDTSRNATVATSATSLTIGALTTLLGIVLSATGFGAPIGAAAIAGGIGSSIAGGVKLGAGLAQNTQQQRNLYNQANSLNNPIGISGLNSTLEDIAIYTKGLSEQDSNIVNADDNMYGYKINTWLPYTDYKVCWDGNYMLCDMTKNYNSVFNILKDIDSLWTKGDSYINEFINALNNGITWFTNGVYIDLATDIFNFEKVRSSSIIIPESVTELVKYGGHYSYIITAKYGNVKDLTLSHYSIKNLTGYAKASITIENDEVVCNVKRTRAIANNISLEVSYRLYKGTYWTLTSNDTFAWVTEPSGTYSLRIAMDYSKTCKVSIIHNGEKDYDTSHYAVIGGTKYIGKQFRVVEGDVWLYAATQSKDAYENIKISYVADGKTWITSTKELVLRGRL